MTGYTINVYRHLPNSARWMNKNFTSRCFVGLISNNSCTHSFHWKFVPPTFHAREMHLKLVFRYNQTFPKSANFFVSLTPKQKCLRFHKIGKPICVYKRNLQDDPPVMLEMAKFGPVPVRRLARRPMVRSIASDRKLRPDRARPVWITMFKIFLFTLRIMVEPFCILSSHNQK